MLTLTTIIKCFVEGQGVYKATTIDVRWLPLSVIKIFFGKGSYLEQEQEQEASSEMSC